MVRVKICCIGSVEEASLAVRHGAAALGLVSAMPSGPGVISEDLIARIAATVSPPIGTFLLTSKHDPDEIIAQQRRCRVNAIQLCAPLPAPSLQTLRAGMPGIALVHVVHVAGEESVAEGLEKAPLVDALLLDSGTRSGPDRQLGGTGKTHDWAVSAEIVAQSPVPVFLAGGLTAENVGEAISMVRPFGVDVCTGVRTDGQLDEPRLEAFLAATREITDH
ncbi:MAG: phosphoribosylanthranilate isomerase [Gemmatimonadota bacterium]|nr:phosphoribosylanthranilate isomerase [Gemmatimonadota bacterium]